jgi:type III pantothenate kinase
MLLAVDIGNTRIKVAVFEGSTLLEQFYFNSSDFQNELHFILNKYKKATELVVATVGNIPKEAFIEFESLINIHFISSDFPFPVTNTYSTPNTLGIDRMVLASGAVLKYPNQNRLVIDAGTCITYDFIDDNDNYLGGAISPGIRLRFESLHNYTAKLPLQTLELIKDQDSELQKIPLIGNSTFEAINSGVINGVINEIEGFISQYEVEYPKFIIILTGGDAEFLAIRLKNTIFANSNFLLESLNQTFQHKIKND